MLDSSLNILGSEWIIIVFVALLALLGSNRLPEATRKLGKVMGQYNKTKNDIQSQIRGTFDANLNVTAPVQNERQKLEFMAKSLNIEFSGMTDDQIRNAISKKMSSQNDAKTKD